MEIVVGWEDLLAIDVDEEVVSARCRAIDEGDSSRTCDEGYAICQFVSLKNWQFNYI